MKTKKNGVNIKSSISLMKNQQHIQKCFCLIMLLIITTAPALAQGNPADEVQSTIEGWSADIQKILNAAVSIFAIGGGFLIFIQYMQGNEQAQKNFIRFIIGLAIFGLVAIIAKIFLPDLNNG